MHLWSIDLVQLYNFFTKETPTPYGSVSHFEAENIKMSLSHFVLGEEHQPEKRTSVDNHIVKKKKKRKERNNDYSQSVWFKRSFSMIHEFMIKQNRKCNTRWVYR